MASELLRENPPESYSAVSPSRPEPVINRVSSGRFNPPPKPPRVRQIENPALHCQQLFTDHTDYRRKCAAVGAQLELARARTEHAEAENSRLIRVNESLSTQLAEQNKKLHLLQRHTCEADKAYHSGLEKGRFEGYQAGYKAGTEFALQQQEAIFRRNREAAAQRRANTKRVKKGLGLLK